MGGVGIDATRAPAARADLLSPAEAATLLASDLATGLSAEEAAARLAADGPNELPPPKRERLGLRLLRQFKEPMALLLLAAAAVAGIGLGENLDAIAILAIVVLNAIIALVQEGKAARDLEALRTMETPMARAVRGGSTGIIPSRELVAGDVVVLAAGDRVPADLRLGETATLEVDESLLTGESLPVAKDARAAPDASAAMADRPWAAFSGTLVTRGAARGLVVATGPRTELGAIAERLGGPEQSTPLQTDLAKLTGRLGAMAVLISVGVFVLTFIRMGFSGEALERAFLPAVALAVAAVPEGLATVIIVALALGVRRMAERGAIVRRLPAVETLGQATVILTDKTGTLTENRMRLDAVVVPGDDVRPPAELRPAERRRVAEVAVLCNDASLEPPVGDPLEIALLEAFREDLPSVLEDAGPRLASAPFEAERKRMATVHAAPAGAALFVKGAPEHVLERCVALVRPGGAREPLGDGDRASLLEAVQTLAARGMRTLALARRDLSGTPEDPAAEERGLELVAVVGLRDPVRPEAHDAVAESRAAGIRLTMVTGDHAATAVSIAAEVGLAEVGAPVLTGVAMRRDGIPADPSTVPVYARVDPDEKLALVEAFQASGDVVAVTGDGVNDAPALRRADIGVAMGRSGSDVAREAADMVVTDDNLATIVSAVREGRGIYENLRKVVDYLVGGNLSEITVVVAGLLLFPALGVPLLPLQLLWINLLTDGLPAVALGVDPASLHLMDRPPRRREARLLTGRRIRFLYARALCIATSSVGALAIARFAWDEPWAHARAVMFTVLVVAHLLYAFAVRRPDVEGGWFASLASNPWLIGAVVAGVALQLLVLTLPFAQELFGTAPLTVREWALVVVGGMLPIAAMVWFLPDRGDRDPRT
jgi:Ca2+-transporting ATPase